jgi:protein-S-isoprenylcysteine O-methyltransferase Ste14
MFMQHLFLVMLWLMFSFFHSIFASLKWKTSMQSFMKQKYRYYRIIYSLFAFGSLSLILIYHFSLNSPLLWKPVPAQTIASIAGIVTGFAGMAFFTKKYFFELSGTDVFQKKKKSETLIQTSLYKYVRHPLYTATLLFVWSIFFYQPLLNNLITCFCITAYTVIGVRFEERKLISEFGESYIQYRSRTPMLFPKIY